MPALFIFHEQGGGGGLPGHSKTITLTKLSCPKRHTNAHHFIVPGFYTHTQLEVIFKVHTVPRSYGQVSIYNYL